jgi:CAAX amino terminal protease family.
MRIFISILLAYLLWYFLFRIEFLNFWIRLLISTSILLSIALMNLKIKIFKPKPKFILIGTLSGIFFYFCLYLGFLAFKPLVYEGAKSVYNLSKELHPNLISAILIFTSTSEEMFWRGYIQGKLNLKYNCYKSLGLTSILYSTIHISSINLPLVFIALVMGLMWGLLYNWSNSLLSVILSHIIWTELVFVVFPLA